MEFRLVYLKDYFIEKNEIERNKKGFKMELLYFGKTSIIHFGTGGSSRLWKSNNNNIDGRGFVKINVNDLINTPEKSYLPYFGLPFCSAKLNIWHIPINQLQPEAFSPSNFEMKSKIGSHRLPTHRPWSLLFLRLNFDHTDYSGR